jgi:hypothetical protein
MNQDGPYLCPGAPPGVLAARLPGEVPLAGKGKDVQGEALIYRLLSHQASFTQLGPEKGTHAARGVSGHVSDADQFTQENKQGQNLLVRWCLRNLSICSALPEPTGLEIPERSLRTLVEIT